MIRRCSYHNSLPYPLGKGRGIKGEGLVNNLVLRLVIKEESPPEISVGSLG